MSEQELQQLRYPVGPCAYPAHYSDEILGQMLLNLETFPQRLEFVVQSLDAWQLETPYRDGGWTLNQVIHHCADSHMNCLVRLKLALTEAEPSIKPYREELWAECADYALPYNNSITILHAVHRKIIALLRQLSHAELERRCYHPQYNKHFAVRDLICLYAWHGQHHLAHITSLKERMGWL